MQRHRRGDRPAGAHDADQRRGLLAGVGATQIARQLLRRGIVQCAGPSRCVASATTCHGLRVVGLDVDAQTRCVHYHSPLDVVALKFRCCGVWHPCIECHRALADHEPQVWRLAERSAQAVLCGVCGLSMSIAAYLASGNSCPRCRAAFNPGCAAHYHLYFEMPSGPNECADG